MDYDCVDICNQSSSLLDNC